VVIGRLEVEGSTCPLGRRAWSTCAWQCSTRKHAPVQHPPLSLPLPHLVLQIDNGGLPSRIEAMGLAAGRLHDGGSVVERLEGSPPGTARTSPSASGYMAFIVQHGTVIALIAETFNRHWRAQHVSPEMTVESGVQH
jgi:hypothetical protein